MRVFGSERNFLAVDIERGAIDMLGDLAVGFGRDAGDFGKAEIGVAELIVLADEVIGVAAADTSLVVTELVPGEAEVIEQVGIADLFEAQGASRGAAAGDGGKSSLKAFPGAEISMFFAVHEAISGNAFPVFRRGLLQTEELAGRIRKCVAETGLVARRPATFSSI